MLQPRHWITKTYVEILVNDMGTVAVAIPCLHLIYFCYLPTSTYKFIMRSFNFQMRPQIRATKNDPRFVPKYIGSKVGKIFNGLATMKRGFFRDPSFCCWGPKYNIISCWMQLIVISLQPDAKLAAIDCTKNRKVVGQVKITGYPTGI